MCFTREFDNSIRIFGSSDNRKRVGLLMALRATERRVSFKRGRRPMFNRQLLPIFVVAIAVFVLAIGGLALPGCASQRPGPGNVKLTLSQVDPVADANDVA